MPMNTRTNDSGAARVARRRARLLLVAAATMAVGAATVAAIDSSSDPAVDEASHKSTEDSRSPHLRTSDGLAGELKGGGTSEPAPSDITVPEMTPRPLPTAPTEATPVRGGTPDAGARSSSDGPSSGAGSGTGLAGAAPSTTTLPPPLYLPGTGQAPILGPVRPRTDDEEEPDDFEPVDVSETSEPEPEPEPHESEPPDPDEADCPALDLYPIGGYAEGTSSTLAALSPRFRALAPDEWAKPTLVCGHGLEPWRDLVIQRLVTEGRADGALVTAADGSSIVMRVSEIEWATYRFRHSEGPVGPNLVGYPVGRMSWGGLEIVQTTAGGLVFAHSEAMGVPLLGGAWDLWVANGGPTGHMGTPTGRPESAMGPIGSDTWVAGMPSTGARQEFSTGWVFLPGVLSDVEAVAQPAERYEWHDASEAWPVPVEPFDYRGHVMQISGISFYVDMEGIRHWIRTGSDWSCATWDLKAVEYRVRGVELARYPLGVEFVCDDYRDNHRE